MGRAVKVAAAKVRHGTDPLDHVSIARELTTWYPNVARVLPWRHATPRAKKGARRDAWLSLVSEFMLQQTQVSRVLEKFDPFVTRFSTPAALAAASQHDVLAMWSGLGYYRRARLLHAASKAVVDVHDGVVPADLESLLKLPGVGRYTAGAIASIVFGVAAPIVDGNVSRVLLRLSAKRATAADAADWSWDHAERLVKAAGDADLDVGVMNEALMELGATVCTPKAPRCEVCPLAASCLAKAKGLVDEIPTPKLAAKRKSITADVVVVTSGKRVLVRQRPASGLWASMWEAPTRETSGEPGDVATESLSGDLGLECELARPEINAFLHKTTHRDVYFRVWRAKGSTRKTARVPTERWVRASEIDSLGLSNPQAGILRAALGNP